MQIQPIRSGSTTCWLLRWAGRTVLVDAGDARDKAFLRRLTRAIDPQQIELIFLTHGHRGHIGHANLLQTRYGIPCALSPADLPLASQTDAQLSPAFHTPEGLPPSAAALPCAGHTAGSHALRVGEHLFVGDAVTVRPFVRLPRRMDDPDAALQSLRQLCTCGAKTVYPAHGRPFSIERLRRFVTKQTGEEFFP